MSWKEQFENGKEFFLKGKFASARQTLEKALESAVIEDNVSRLQKAEIKLELGRTLRVVASYDDARQNLSEALEVFRDEEAAPSANCARALNYLGLLHQDLDEYDESQAVLEEGLKIAGERFGTSHEEFADLLNSMGLLHWRKADDDQSNHYYYRALESYSNSIGEENYRYAETIDNIGINLQRMGEFEKAAEHHERSIAMREKCLGADHPDIGYGLLNLATARARLGDDRTYEELATRAITMFQNGYGEYSPETALAISNLGTHYLEQFRYKEAHDKFKRSLEIREKIYGPDHVRLTASLKNMSVALHFLDRKEEAESYRERAQNLLVKLNEKEGGKNLDTVVTLADSLSSSGDKDGALKLLTNSISNIESSDGSDSPKLIRLLELLGALHSGDSPETAKESFFKLVRLKKKLYGKKHPSIAKTLRVLAGCYQAQMDATTTQILQNQAKAIEFKNELDNPEEQALLAIMTQMQENEDSGDEFASQMMVTMLRMQGKDDEADELERKQLQRAEEKLGADSLEYAAHLRTKALGSFDNEFAVDQLEKALSIQLKHPDAKFHDIEMTLNLLSQQFFLNNKFDKQEQVLLRILSKYDEEFGKDHWQTKSVYKQLATAAERQGKSVESQDYQSQADAIRDATEEEQEELQRKSNAMLEENLSRMMGGLGSMIQALGGSIEPGGGDTTRQEQE